MTSIAAITALCLVVIFARRRLPHVDAALRAIPAEPSRGLPPPDMRADRAWLLGGLCLLVVAIAILEAMQPYYFLQDDVFIFELPAMLFGARSLWDGRFPDYNPFSLCGVPLASLGGTSLTYPPTYLAYAIARHLLRDEFAMADVFAVGHIVAGYFLARRAARLLGQGPAPATLASLSFVLSGGILIMGRSWHMIVPIAVWELPGADPLAFPAQDRSVSLPVYMHGGGVDVDLSGIAAGGRMVVNIASRLALRATVDGEPVSLGDDEWGRVVLEAPPRSKRLEIRYSPGWTRAVATASFPLALAMLTALLLKRRRC